MLDTTRASELVEMKIAGVKVQACVPYKNDFLVRVLLPFPLEQNFDPFFLVKSETLEILEFSVMTDGDPVEIAKAFENGGI